MSLRLILGRAGTGKTRRCLDEIRAELGRNPDGPALVFLVPEQATFQTEYALATTPGLGGVMRAQVTSFRRLAHSVLREAGGAARPHLGELAKRMLLRALLEDLRPRLRAFGRAAAQPGFAGVLADALSEIKFYGLAPPDLAEAGEALAAQSPDPLADKLADLAMLSAALEQTLAGRYTDPDDYLYLLAERLPHAASLRGAVFWIDGFTGFTPQEYLVLGQIMRCAARVNLALCLDGRFTNEPPAETDVFYPTRTTLARVRTLAAERRVPEEPPLILDTDMPPRFAGAPALAHLERFFFVRPAPPCKGVDDPRVRLVAAANRRAEVEAAAREIVRLARDHGLRWRDMAVILRDLESYHELIGAVFTDHGIPFFIDRKRPVLHHPLVELIRAALEVAAAGWHYDPLFRYLKTDLAPLSRDEVDRLENYVLAHGIRGACWTDGRPWAYRRRYTLRGEGDGEGPPTAEEAAELAAVNSARERAVPALHAFCRTAAANANVRELTAALFRFLEDLGVPARIEAWRREAESAGRLDEAREHAQVWQGILEVLDQVVEALGDRTLPLDDYARVLDTGLESLRLGLIPPALDQVLVGSLDRSRSPEIQAAFVLGAGDGVLPARPGDGALLGDAERERLREMGLELAPGGRRRLLDEQYLVYIALTRGSRYLWISYPMADEGGGALAPSPVVERLRRLLPGLRLEFSPAGPGDDGTSFITRPAPTLAHLLDRLRAARDGEPLPSLWRAAYNWFQSRPAWAPTLRRLTAALFHRNRESPLRPETSARLFGNPIRASVSRLERYRACPFAHFLEYGLRLRERPVQRLAPPDLGQFFHAALEQLTGEVIRDGRDWGSLTAADCAALADRIVSGLAPQLQSEILLSTARHRYLTGKLRSTVERAALVLGEHARRGRFRPVAFEIAFGPDGPLPPVRLPEIELAGRIDRVDAAVSDSGVLLRIVDYKSGRTGLTLAEIDYGLKIQLLTYLDVALTHAPRLLGSPDAAARPAGILYFTLQNPLLRESGPLEPAEIERRLLRRLRMDGFVLADREAIFLMDRDAGTTSDLIPVRLTKDGFGMHSRVLTQEQFDLLRNHLYALLAEASEAVAGGIVDIAPYRRGDETACRYCPFPAVCRFDRQFPDNAFRILRDDPPEAFWARLRRRYARGGEEGLS